MGCLSHTLVLRGGGNLTCEVVPVGVSEEGLEVREALLEVLLTAVEE